MLKQNKMKQPPPPATKTTHGVWLALADKLDDVQNETSKYWVLIGMSSSSPAPQGLGISVEGEAERVVKVRDDGWQPRKQSLLDTTWPVLIWARRLWWHRFKTAKPHAWKGQVDTKSHSNQETMCSWHLLGKRKSVSSDGKSLAIATTLQGTLHDKE